MTLLEIVQEILDEMDGDLVNSIYDTDESEQVAKIVRATYRNIVSNTNWPSHRRVTKLVAASDTDRPTHASLADEVKELVEVYYDTVKSGETRKNYTKMSYLSPEEFLYKTNMRNSTDADVDIIIDTSGVEFLIQTNKAPSYFTSFDDTNIVFDSYDSDVDTTIQTSKMQAIAYVMTELSLSDTSTPDLPPDALAMLLEESKSRAQAKLRQFNDVKSEQEAVRQRRSMSRKSWRAHGGIKSVDFGRRPTKSKEPTFRGFN